MPSALGNVVTMRLLDIQMTEIQLFHGIFWTSLTSTGSPRCDSGWMWRKLKARAGSFVNNDSGHITKPIQIYASLLFRNNQKGGIYRILSDFLVTWPFIQRALSFLTSLDKLLRNQCLKLCWIPFHPYTGMSMNGFVEAPKLFDLCVYLRFGNCDNSTNASCSNHRCKDLQWKTSNASSWWIACRCW